SVTPGDSKLVARHWFDRFVTHIGINPAIGIKLQVAGASQVRRFFHDPRRAVRRRSGARRPQPCPDAQSGAPRSPRIRDGPCRAACSGPHPCGRRGIPSTLSRLRTLPCFAKRCGGIEREVLVLGSLEQVEFDEAGHIGQLRIATEPYFLEGLFGTFLHAEAVHGDEHGLVSCFNGARINLGMSATWVRLHANWLEWATPTSEVYGGKPLLSLPKIISGRNG